MRNLLLLVWAVVFTACSVKQAALPVEGPYEAEWTSLEKHEAVPDWMRDGRHVERATLLSVKKNYNCQFEQRADALRVTIPQNGRYPSDAAQVVRLELE